MGRKKAIKLPSSEEILYRCDSDFFENTLVSLLEEGWELKLKDNDRIFITYENLPNSFSGDYPTESDLILNKKTISYKELKDSYKRGYDRDYSPEIEKERHDFNIAVMERRGQARAAWGAYSATMDYIRAVEEAQKEQNLINEGDDKGLEKLRAKQNKRQHILRIG